MLQVDPAAKPRCVSVERRDGTLAAVHPESGKEVWVTVHGHDAGRLGNRILRDAGVE
jgi:hypothetical protein